METKTPLYLSALLWLAGAILAITGLAKVISAFGSVRALDAPDLIFGLSYRWFFLVVGGLELVAATYIFRSKNIGRQSLILVIITTDILLYRCGLWLLHSPGLCPCLGNITDSIHLAAVSADKMLQAALVYMTITGYAVFLYRWKHLRISIGSPER